MGWFCRPVYVFACFSTVCCIPYALGLGAECSVPMDLVIALDASTSVGYTNFQLCLRFAYDIISTADIDGGKVRVGVLTYSSYTWEEFQLNTYSTKAKVQNHILNTYYSEGGTYIGYAINQMRNMFTSSKGDRPEIDNVAFVMTDGVSADEIAREAEAARKEGIILYAFGIGSDISMSNLKDIASEPVAEHVYTVDSFSDLSGLGNKLFVTMCTAITVTTQIMDMTTTSTSTTTTAATTSTTAAATTSATTTGATTAAAVTTSIAATTSTTAAATTTTTTTDVATTPTTAAATTKYTTATTTTAEILSIEEVTQSTSTVITTNQIAGVRKCKCPCGVLGDKRYVNLSVSEIQSFIETFKTDLLRDKRSLTSWVRNHNSAADNRNSSKAIAISIAVTFLVVPCILLGLVDLDRYLRYLDKKLKKKKQINVQT